MINAGNGEREMKNREKGNGKREGERKIGIGKWNGNFFVFILRLTKRNEK